MGNTVNVTFDLLPEQTYKGTVTLVYPELSPIVRNIAGAHSSCNWIKASARICPRGQEQLSR